MLKRRKIEEGEIPMLCEGLEDAGPTDTDSSNEGSNLAGEHLQWWREWTVPRRGFMSQLLREVPFPLGPVVQVCDAQGFLQPPDALLLQQETVQIWTAGRHDPGAGAATQATRLPANVGSFLRPSMTNLTPLNFRACGSRMIRSGLVWMPWQRPRTGRSRSLAPWSCTGAWSPKAISAFLHKGHWISMHWKVEIGRVQSCASAPPGAGFEEVAVAHWLMSHPVPGAMWTLCIGRLEQ